MSSIVLQTQFLERDGNFLTVGCTGCAEPSEVLDMSTVKNKRTLFLQYICDLFCHVCDFSVESDQIQRERAI